MHDPTYPSAPPPISRELDRIATGLTAGGAILTGTSVSAPDEMGDIAWQAPEDGTAWMCVVSRLDATLWSEWAEGGKDAPAANDAEMAAPPPTPSQRWRDAENEETDQGGAR